MRHRRADRRPCARPGHGLRAAPGHLYRARQGRAALTHKADIHLLTADNLAVEGNHRDKAGFVELHEKLTDVFYVTDGEATFVTGGHYQGGERFAPGQIRGGTLTGGTVHYLVKGDVIVIPAGVPHWFKDVPSSISYFGVAVVGP